MRTPVNGNRLILIFFDPDCPHCHDVISQMIADSALSAAIDAGKVTVLAVYTEGDDTVWKRVLPDMPRNWMVATDGAVIKMSHYTILRPCLLFICSMEIRR